MALGTVGQLGVLGSGSDVTRRRYRSPTASVGSAASPSVGTNVTAGPRGPRDHGLVVRDHPLAAASPALVLLAPSVLTSRRGVVGGARPETPSVAAEC